MVTVADDFLRAALNPSFSAYISLHRGFSPVMRSLLRPAVSRLPAQNNKLLKQFNPKASSSHRAKATVL